MTRAKAHHLVRMMGCKGIEDIDGGANEGGSLTCQGDGATKKMEVHEECLEQDKRCLEQGMKSLEGWKVP